MNSKFRTSIDEIDEEEDRKWRQRSRAAADARRKEEKRRAKQEAQKERAKAETYYKKGEKYQPPPPSIDEIRQTNLRLLGLRADQDNPIAIRSAFRKMALRLHPDKNPATDAAEQFKKLRQAYEALL